MRRTLQVEKLFAACPPERTELRMRIARLRAEGASIRAATYRFVLDSENAIPDASGSMMRLSFAEFAHRHEWTVGDMIIWDNTGVMHRVEKYPADSGRLLSRTTLVGEEPLV